MSPNMSQDSIASIGTGRLGRVVVARLAPGADLLESILEIARREGILSGVILSGAASLKQVAIRNVGSVVPKLPVTDGDRLFLTLNGPYELLAIAGSLSDAGGEPYVHAHITVSDGADRGVAYGGHLLQGCIVYTLAELVIAELEGVALTRPFDPVTGSAKLAITECDGGLDES